MNSTNPGEASLAGLRLGGSSTKGPRCLQAASATVALSGDAPHSLKGFPPMGRPIEQVVEHMANHALAIDHIGDPPGQNTQGIGHAKGPPELIALIDEQGEGELMAGGEALVAGGVIAAHPPHLGAQGLEIGETIAEGASFRRAARRVVLGIEKQHQGRPSQLVAASLHALSVPQGDGGSQITGSEGGGHWERMKVVQP